MISTPCTVKVIRELTPYYFVPSKVLGDAFGIDQSALTNHKLHSISKLLWSHPDASVDEKNTQLVRAIELYESLDPADGAEGMLAEQMVGSHSAALECLRRAVVAGQTFAGRDVALKHAAKLMALYAKQLETMNKHRGKGQQKVTVEHVNVEPGGQAIVGHIETGNTMPNSSQAAIEHRTETTLEDVTPTAASRKSRIRK